MAKKVDISNSVGVSAMNLMKAAKGAALTQDLGILFNSSNNTTGEKFLLDVKDIEDNPFQPRIDINKSTLKELSESILTEGQIQPIVVQKKKNKYIVIAGHRRLYAHRLISKQNIWVSVIEEEYSNSIENNKLLFRKATIENVQRDQLSPLEVALACNEAINNGLYTSREDLAKILNKSKSYVIKVMSIIKLSQVIIADLSKNKSINDIESLYELQKIKDFKKQEKLYFELIDKKINRDDIRREAKSQNHQSNYEPVLYKKTKDKISLQIDLKNIDANKIVELESIITRLLAEFQK